MNFIPHEPQFNSSKTRSQQSINFCLQAVLCFEQLIYKLGGNIYEYYKVLAAKLELKIFQFHFYIKICITYLLFNISTHSGSTQDRRKVF